MLKIEGLRVRIGEKEIVRGVDLEIDGIVAMLGPNGSGKSTLGYALAGMPGMEVEGKAILTDGRGGDGIDILSLEPEERARKGLFLAFQHPPEIEGLSYRRFLRTAWERLGMEGDFDGELAKAMEKLGIGREFLRRDLNRGFSGGEKKRMELLQLLLFKPRVAVIDEIDSGLDVDSLRIAADVIREMDGDVLIITHYTRLINLVKPGKVVVMKDGRIVAEGGMEVAERIDRHGYSL